MASDDPAERLQHLPDLRLSYDVPPLRRGNLPAAPGAAFAEWFEAAEAAGVVEPNAMTLATVAEDGMPAARTVLLKGVTGTGFQFFTNYQSRKAWHLAVNPRATLLFAWLPLFRQVAISGSVRPVAAAESDEYFATRPRGSQVAAWASSQSQELPSRDSLEAAWREAERRFADGPVPRPPHWGGYEVRPVRIEFWQGQPSRLHDRVVFDSRSGEPAPLDEPAAWCRRRLAP